LPKHPTTPLASAQVNHDQLKIELVEPLDSPPMVRVTWPAAPTMIPTRRFPDVASGIATLFARAHIVLAGLRAHGR
jgi:hypothetical protein